MLVFECQQIFWVDQNPLLRWCESLSRIKKKTLRTGRGVLKYCRETFHTCTEVAGSPAVLPSVSQSWFVLTISVMITLKVDCVSFLHYLVSIRQLRPFCTFPEINRKLWKCYIFLLCRRWTLETGWIWIFVRTAVVNTYGPSLAGSADFLHNLANKPDICNRDSTPSAILMCV